MEKAWIGCNANNFLKGRPTGFHPQAIVLHRFGGTLDKIRVFYYDPAAATSAHYAVSKAGRVSQYVEEADTAFHAGVVVSAQWPLLKPRVNPNFYTIGIEHEGELSGTLPEEQQEASAALISEVAARWTIPIDSAHVIVHTQIRASRLCPGDGFHPEELVQRAQIMAATRTPAFGVTAPRLVEILKTSNVREGAPSSRARIVHVLTPGTKVNVAGFTLQGERTLGNPAWYETEEGNFFWAGNSAAPQPNVPEQITLHHTAEQPAAPQAPAQAPAQAEAAPPVFATEAAPPVFATEAAPPVFAAAAAEATPRFCATGIGAIDKLFGAPPCPPLAANDPDRRAGGAVQDLLAGHGYRMPSILSPSYGDFGISTRNALLDFQGRSGLHADGIVTAETMRSLATVPASNPRATAVHLALVLGVPLTGMLRVLTLTALMEGAGKFGAINANTDRAGLSFGLIQWAQRPGRLKEILHACEKAAHDPFVRIFAAGDESLAGRLLLHVAKPSGGVDPNTGKTTDPAFDLVSSPWIERFQEAALDPLFQHAQVDLANTAFLSSFQKMQKYATLIKSQRGVAFMLDVANQFGDGNPARPARGPDPGAAGLYRKAAGSNTTEAEVLTAIADHTVSAMPDRLKVGVRARRDLFLKTTLLTAEPFELA